MLAGELRRWSESEEMYESLTIKTMEEKEKNVCIMCVPILLNNNTLREHAKYTAHTRDGTQKSNSYPIEKK